MYHSKHKTGGFVYFLLYIVDCSMDKFLQIWKTEDLRNKVLIALGLLLLTRVLTHVPIPAVNVANLRNFFNQNQFLNLLDVFSGGGLSNLSIVMLGVGPYITSSIIVQLLTIVIPSWTEMQKEGGEAGREILTSTRATCHPAGHAAGVRHEFICSQSGASGTAPSAHSHCSSGSPRSLP